MKKVIKTKAFNYFSSKVSARMLRHKTSNEYFENWFNNKPPGYPNYIKYNRSGKKKFVINLNWELL